MEPACLTVLRLIIQINRLPLQPHYFSPSACTVSITSSHMIVRFLLKTTEPQPFPTVMCYIYKSICWGNYFPVWYISNILEHYFRSFFLSTSIIQHFHNLIVRSLDKFPFSQGKYSTWQYSIIFLSPLHNSNCKVMTTSWESLMLVPPVHIPAQTASVQE